MKNSIIAAGAFGLLSFMACSDNSTAGNEIEPNAIAEISSSSEIASSSSNSSVTADVAISFAIEEDFGKFTTPPVIITTSQNFNQGQGTTTNQGQDTISICAYEEEKGTSGICFVNNQELSGVVRIQDNLIIRSYSGLNLGIDINNIINEFQKTCANVHDNADKYIDTLIVDSNSFKLACVTQSDYMSFDEVTALFQQTMETNCKQLKAAKIVSIVTIQPINTEVEYHIDSVPKNLYGPPPEFDIKPIDTLYTEPVE